MPFFDCYDKGEECYEREALGYTLRVDRHVFQKFRYVAEYEGRSANKEIEQFLKKSVSEFEEKHGKIELETTTKL